MALKAAEKKRAAHRRIEAKKDDDQWAKISKKMDELKEREVFAEALGRHGRSRPRRGALLPAAALRFKAIPCLLRERAVRDVLAQIRGDHGDRWGSRTLLQRYRGASKRYTTAEARGLLDVAHVRGRARPLPPTDRAIREWPPLAFYLPWNGAATLPPSTWRRHTLRDLVVFAYSCARDEAFDDEATAVSSVSGFAAAREEELTFVSA